MISLTLPIFCVSLSLIFINCFYKLTDACSVPVQEKMTVEGAMYTEIQLKADLFSGTVVGTEGFEFSINQEQRHDK